MAYTNPTVTDFKEYFTRDFPYGSDSTTVQDSDITKALAQAAYNFNPDLFADQASYTLCFLWLTAHYMVFDLQTSSQGVSGAFTWLVQSKGVGSVSESYGIPQRILESPELSFYSKTNYGAKYLSLILPFLSGQIFTTLGSTRP